MPPATPQPPCAAHFSAMLRLLNRRLRRLCSRLRWPARRRSKTKIAIKRFGKPTSKSPNSVAGAVGAGAGTAAIHPKGESAERPIRVATFNAAMFSMAPVAPPEPARFAGENHGGPRWPEERNLRAKSMNDRPKSILKQSPLHPSSTNCTDGGGGGAKSKLRVSINLPDNEISLLRSRRLSFAGDEKPNSSPSSPASSVNRAMRDKTPLRSSSSVSFSTAERKSFRSGRTVLEVLRELDADVLALQDVKAEEEKDMKPLSDLAGALGMSYVFAESWAPEYGNAILSKFPIKRHKVQKIFDDSDFRNVLRATIDVPRVGEVNFHCTHLDHLDENWRMKQVHAIINSSDGHHILAGGLNSLDESDYSPERWADIVKYYEETGKPTPKAEVMKFLKEKQYIDAKDFAGECESVVMIAKGQSVQGTCKYGTRVDYVLTSPNSPYKFVPGSYSVFSSKGTSDHHIVKVDLIKTVNRDDDVKRRKREQHKEKLVKMVASSPSKGVWTIQT